MFQVAHGLAQQLVGRQGQHAEEESGRQSRDDNPHAVQKQLKLPLLALLAEIAPELTLLVGEGLTNVSSALLKCGPALTGWRRDAGVQLSNRGDRQKALAGQPLFTLQLLKARLLTGVELDQKEDTGKYLERYKSEMDDREKDTDTPEPRFSCRSTHHLNRANSKANTVQAGGSDNNRCIGYHYVGSIQIPGGSENLKGQDGDDERGAIKHQQYQGGLPEANGQEKGLLPISPVRHRWIWKDGGHEDEMLLRRRTVALGRLWKTPQRHL
jgi:hypothetical protein